MKMDPWFDSDYPLLIRVPIIKAVQSCEVEALTFGGRFFLYRI
jgi:hypothetical protein